MINITYKKQLQIDTDATVEELLTGLGLSKGGSGTTSAKGASFVGASGGMVPQKFFEILNLLNGILGTKQNGASSMSCARKLGHTSDGHKQKFGIETGHIHILFKNNLFY